MAMAMGPPWDRHVRTATYDTAHTVCTWKCSGASWQRVMACHSVCGALIRTMTKDKRCSSGGRSYHTPSFPARTLIRALTNKNVCASTVFPCPQSRSSKEQGAAAHKCHSPQKAHLPNGMIPETVHTAHTGRHATACWARSVYIRMDGGYAQQVCDPTTTCEPSVNRPPCEVQCYFLFLNRRAAVRAVVKCMAASPQGGW